MNAKRLFYLFVLLTALLLSWRLFHTRTPPAESPLQPKPAMPVATGAPATPSPTQTATADPSTPSVAPDSEPAALPKAPPATSSEPPSSLRAWMETAPPGDNADRNLWIEQGITLASEHRDRLADFIQNDPERALQEAVTPRQYDRMPEKIRALIERPVSEEGFYGVMAVCSHGSGDTHSRACEIRHEVVLDFGTSEAEAYNAAIHGARRERMTEENAAINGVVLDKWIALYPGDVVIHNDGPAFAPNRYSVYYKGLVGTAIDRKSAEELAREIKNTSFQSFQNDVLPQ